jgi:hypothetical protein
MGEGVEVKRTLLIPYFGKIKGKQTLLMKELKKIEAERTLLIPEIRKVEANKCAAGLFFAAQQRIAIT